MTTQAPEPSYGPGSLVAIRGREWVVLEASDDGVLARPLGGGDDEAQLFLPALEVGIRPATFDPPDAGKTGPSVEAQMLRDALLLTLRRGAGPFRSFGRLTFTPHAYQLAPLLMSLKLDPVRLLIADDVGIGKTVEAGLIARELLDRGEITRIGVLCPPHLVDQWVQELKVKFGLDAVGVTATSAARLERGLRVGMSLYEEHPFTVTSLDYIKQDRRAADFARVCPRFLIVDEAHACLGGAGGQRHRRYDLLKRLAADEKRHIVLLTATPHSGDVNAFARLAGLLHRDFAALEESDPEQHKELRERLGAHFVQRRRVDIDAWKEPGLFPIPEKKEQTYRLLPEASQFYSDVLDYCAAVTERAGNDDRRKRLAFWGTLALMRCVASSPAAALQALRARAKIDDVGDAEAEAFRARALDGDDDDAALDDTEATIAIDDPLLAALIDMAEALASDVSADAKLKKLLDETKKLLDDKFNPVVFCRFIGTAKGLGAALEKKFRDVQVTVITGELPPDERQRLVEEVDTTRPRILVATDCLSEGVNLQAYFDAVVHYDLCWNPTRHQQREGRVNRFGQRSKKVRSLLLYGENNPVDGAVLEVILRKAEKIRDETGVPVPLPDDERAMTEALMSAVLLRRKRSPSQPMLPFADLPEAQKIDKAWTDASKREKQAQTIYAQRALKPEAVIPEWEKARDMLGGDPAVTRRFLEAAFDRFAAPLTKVGERLRLTFPGDAQFDALRKQLMAAGVEDGMLLDFRPGPESLHRAHPLVSTVGETLLERALDPESAPRDDIATLARSGVWVSRDVAKLTTIALLRLQHRLEPRDGSPALLAEEASAVAWGGREPAWPSAAGLEALKLLDARGGEAELADAVKRTRLQEALRRLDLRKADLDAHAAERARQLEDDHGRVREATMRNRSTSVARVDVTPITPVDVIGLYVLVPKVD